MKSLRFDWDPAKAESNLRKHDVSFAEAQTIFYDENAIEFYDDEHSEWEDRFLLLGISSRLRLLIVCHCYRADDGVIRLISARKATQQEAAYYQR
ncbi:MAG: BrnT family toxin [Chloroflexi bacterium]|nr:BrnT family toxin [Chloroflexota bacterium]